MKKFEKMIFHQDTAYQEKLSEELANSKAPFYTPISPNLLYGWKRLSIISIFNEKIFFRYLMEVNWYDCR